MSELPITNFSLAEFPAWEERQRRYEVVGGRMSHGSRDGLDDIYALDGLAKT